MSGCFSPGDTDADSDSVVVVFDTHADAVAFQSQMLTSGMLSSDGQVVVGENWAINTVLPYGNQVEAHLGGQIVDAP